MKRYIFLIMLLPVFLAANEYTLDQLVEYGLEHSYQIRKQELSDESSKSALKSSKWNMLPDADLSLGLNQDLDPISPKSGFTNSAGFGINKTISLNDPAYFNYRQALLDRDISRIELE